ncbi:MAG: DUF5947 family protein [Gemmatimonadaceae bacterium]
MGSLQLSSASRSFGRLKQLAEKPRAVERCDMCGRDISGEHDHLMQPAERRLVCVCGACGVLFSGETGTKYRRVPRRVKSLGDFRMTDGQWEALRLPINLAFFFRSTPAERVVAAYPSPAGATESMLSLDAWEDIERDNPTLLQMEPDVEALLVNRVGSSRNVGPAEYFLVPIDRCYKLVGLIRTKWTGLSGGGEVWGEIAHFFDDLRGHPASANGSVHA